MDYYRMTNVKADTEMRTAIGQAGSGPATPPSAGPTEP